MICNETAPSLKQEPEEAIINPEWLSAVNPRKEPFFPQKNQTTGVKKIRGIFLSSIVIFQKDMETITKDVAPVVSSKLKFIKNHFGRLFHCTG